jgi:hypothetical protein
VRLTISLLLLVLSNTAYTQCCDTVFYSNNTIVFVIDKLNPSNQVGQSFLFLALYDEQGKNILNDGVVFHTFFDKKFGKKRCIKIVNKILFEDYWVSESDTLYNYFPVDENFETRLQSFYGYLEQQVVYPKNALKKGVEATVKISLIIDKNGTITNVFPLTKHEWGFEESLIRTIKEKKQFGFVVHKNKPIKLYLEVPFAFKVVKK